MSVGWHLRRKAKNGSKLLVGGAKATKDGVKSVSGRKKESGGRRSKDKMNNSYLYEEPQRNVKGHLDEDGVKRLVDGKKKVASERASSIKRIRDSERLHGIKGRPKGARASGVKKNCDSKCLHGVEDRFKVAKVSAVKRSRDSECLHGVEERSNDGRASDIKKRSKTKTREISTPIRKVVDEVCLLDKNAKGKYDSIKHIGKRHGSRQPESLSNSTRKSQSCKTGPVDGLGTTDNARKKQKRVIRIDPHDISNKRLTDGAFMSENIVEKNTEVSKNAQFRAIQPTADILNFVEDNLIGRRRLIELRKSGYNIKLSAPLDNIPFSESLERERIEENVFRNKLSFFAAAKVSSSFPPVDLPEIAFAGRSNVGKSSLLNALTRQWGVVRTSDKPGLTQTINFFNLASKLCLVDLPGYGFAYAKEEVKDAWEELVKEYVSTRAGLARVCLLVDTKWGMKPRDHELIDLMERSQTKYQVVLTKTDVVFPMDVARRAMQIQENLRPNTSVVNPVMMVSSKTGAGIRSLRKVLSNIMRFTK